MLGSETIYIARYDAGFSSCNSVALNRRIIVAFRIIASLFRAFALAVVLVLDQD